MLDNIAIEWLFGSDSAILDHVAVTLTNAWTWLPLYLALVVLIIKNNDSMQQIAACLCFALLCVALSSIVSNAIAKPLVERPRPCNTLAVKYLAQIAGGIREKDFSFFSSHAANTMSLAIYFALLVRSRALTLTLLLWSLANCWTRLYLGQHYLTDVLVGIAWGAISGVLSYSLYRKACGRMATVPHYVSSQYTRSGYSQLDVDTVMSVFVLTVACALIPIS